MRLVSVAASVPFNNKGSLCEASRSVPLEKQDQNCCCRWAAVWFHTEIICGVKFSHLFMKWGECRQHNNGKININMRPTEDIRSTCFKQQFIFLWGLRSVLRCLRVNLTLKMVFSSSDVGVCRVACFQGIWNSRWSGLSHCRPGYLPLFTWANNQGFRRILRGWTLMARGLEALGVDGRLEGMGKQENRVRVTLYTLK